MKVWHDDIRPAPDGWTWARTNNDAKRLLLEHNVECISLDHDMGLDQLDPESPEAHTWRGFSEDNGMRLVEWMVDNQLVPDEVIIHSWNIRGAKRMYMHLNEHGYACEYEAYTPVGNKTESPTPTRRS
jgi:hypothetical protein